MSRQIYDAQVKFTESDARLAAPFVGNVYSTIRGEPGKDEHRNNFRLERITVSGHSGIWLELEPHDNARQDVSIELGREQAAWLVAALQGALHDHEAYKAKDEAAKARQRERAKQRKADRGKPENS